MCRRPESGTGLDQHVRTVRVELARAGAHRTETVAPGVSLVGSERYARSLAPKDMLEGMRQSLLQASDTAFTGEPQRGLIRTRKSGSRQND